MPSPWQDHSFISATAAANNWLFQSTDPNTFLIQSTANGLPWSCTLQIDLAADPTPDSSINFLCPQLAISPQHIQQVLNSLHSPGPLPVPQLHVQYPSSVPPSDLSLIFDLFSAFRRFRKNGLNAALNLPPPPPPKLQIFDTANILDPQLLHRLSHWPDAYDYLGRRLPAQLGIVRIEPTGFHLRSSNWWASAPALTHQIQLGIDLILRLQPHFPNPSPSPQP